MANILFVRAMSGLDSVELDRRLLEPRPRFRDVPGPAQKIYGRDPATGAMRGIYFFDSAGALAAFRETGLARTIASAYAVEDIRVEVCDMRYPLYPECGPISG